MSNLVTPKGCCDLLPPFAKASQVRQVPAIPSEGSVVASAPQAYTITLANGNNVFDELGVTSVRSFRVSNTSNSSLTVTTGAGSIAIEAGQSQAWGDSEKDVKLDVAEVRIAIVNAPVTLTWDE